MIEQDLDNHRGKDWQTDQNVLAGGPQDRVLRQEQIDFFQENGYLVVENLLDDKDVLAPIRGEYAQLMENLWESWRQQGQLPDPHGAKSFSERIIYANRAGLEYFQPMDISLPPGDITPDTPFHAGPAVFNMIINARLLDVVESLIGPEITSNPIQHVRIKPPAYEVKPGEIRAHIAATDWHQDRGVGLAEADQTRMVTTWVAVSDATVENGCLQVIPRSHLEDLLPHCPSPQLGIPHHLLDRQKAQALPVRAGGVLFFHPLTIHSSLDNQTKSIRWSFDLRYHVTGEASGRAIFPDFVVRSRSGAREVMHDPAKWRRLWENARDHLATGGAVKIHRWEADGAHCA